MEILVTLRNIASIGKLLPVVDGVIVGKHFTSCFDLSLQEISYVNNMCKENGKSIYIMMDNFVSENEKMLLYEYLDFISTLDVSGIYFHDLGIFDAAKSYGLLNKLIYDGKTVLCNSLDTAFMLDKGIDSVLLSRELTLKEITEIADNNYGKVDIQIFGHLRMSYSKRKFLTNYFKEIDKDYDYLNSQTIRLVEEKREYQMPIVEDENGTYIYTDYIFEMFDEITDLRPFIKRGIVDSLFIDDACIQQVCRDYRRINNENKNFIKSNIFLNYPGNYSSGYLYQKTNITKDG